MEYLSEVIAMLLKDDFTYFSSLEVLLEHYKYKTKEEAINNRIFILEINGEYLAKRKKEKHETD